MATSKAGEPVTGRQPASSAGTGRVVTVTTDGEERVNVTDTELIDVRRALQLLEECVAERGADYVYPPDPDPDGLACFYVFRDVNLEPTGPGCIAGLLLSKLGLLDRATEGISFDGLRVAEENFTREARLVVREAQAYQDKGDTWGAALEAAKQRASDAA